MNYLKANTELWNQRVDAHVNSEFYDNESFLAGRNSLNSIELGLLGNVNGKKVAHLQCHFGQDSLSLARMGAKVTGVDISDAAIDKARELNQRLNLDAEFVVSDILTLDKKVEQKFDVVFASYGVIGWHPDIERWFEMASYLLKPGGQLVFVEFHPVVWMFDNNLSKVVYSYFNKEPIIETVTNSYTDGSQLEQPLKEYGWNHSLSEVFNAIQKAGLILDSFDEYDYSPYDCLGKSVPSEHGFQIEGLEGKLPLVYSLSALKK
ncbi:class I SAM-dependent methyltransferase [Pleionea sediminis]|uniref:class I SAM-dependent methyltransferase n=1 Tax=Pleionea sediminis TaxID=2569479 RepID=UPI00197C1E68|nr:class I SAM-dependent methyltransferase [Pleionea sediminis]